MLPASVAMPVLEVIKDHELLFRSWTIDGTLAHFLISNFGEMEAPSQCLSSCV